MTMFSQVSDLNLRRIIVFLLIGLATSEHLTLGQEPSPEEAESVIPNASPPLFHTDWITAKWRGESATPRMLPSSENADLIQPTFDDPESVLAFILGHCQDEETVFPSERYFYYRFDLGHRRVSGNLRFSEVDQGIVHVGYFDTCDRSRVQTTSIRDGVNGKVSREGDLIRVEYQGMQKSFRLDRSWSAENTAPPKLAPDERLITGILDESGFYLWLIYSSATNHLYYILNEDRPLPDRLVSCPHSFLNAKVGVESRFVFLHDPPTNRWILTGVSQDCVESNDYYDGAFDQVPPDLQIKEVLESVYPYCKERGGIDTHGNFIQLDSQRMAISPYQQYSTVDEHLAFVAKTYLRYSVDEAPSRRWAAVVHESKMDFHEVLARHRQGQSEPPMMSRPETPR